MGFRMVWNFSTPDDPFGVEGQGQTLETSNSIISKTVRRDREMVSIEVK